MKNIGIIDIETSGFLNDGGYIVEIGIVSLNIDTGERHILYDSLIKEDGYSDSQKGARIYSNSSLRHEDVMRAPSLEAERGKIQKIINSIEGGVTAYNNAFDFGFLRDRGFIISRPLPCPMLIATPVLKIPGKKSWQKDNNTYKRPSVQEARDMMIGEEYTEEHRGADDALHEAKIVYKLIQDGHYPIYE